MRKLLLVLFVLLGNTLPFYASYGLHYAEKLNNMLSNNAILCMHQDTQGFMWFGTYDGLNLYDGQKVTTFRYESNNTGSLSGNSIHKIEGLGTDYLWIATLAGLDKFSIKERKVVESYPEYKKGDLLVTDKGSNTYLLVKDNYISYYDSTERKFEEIYLKDGIVNDVRSFFVDRNDQLCIVKRNGILQYVTLTKDKDAAANYSLTIQENRIHNKAINQVFYEDNQVYFIDEDFDLFFYDIYKQQKILLRNISDIVEQYGIIASLVFFHQEIFIAFMHSGLIKLNVSNQSKPEPVNMTIGIFTLRKDHFQDAIWVGTDGLGVELYYMEKDNFGNIMLNNLPFMARRPIRAFYTDEENTLWIGTKGDGIFRIKDYSDFRNNQVSAKNIQRMATHSGHYENPVYCFRRSIYNNNNDLWIGTDGGISYYSYKDKKIFQLEDTPDSGTLLSNVHTLCEVDDSTLWVSSKGLYQVIIDKTKHPYKVVRKTPHIFSRDGVDVYDEYYSMVYDGHSKLFIGSMRGYGVLHIDIHTKEYHYISMDNADNRGIGDVICLHLDPDSVLYLGASSGLTQIKMNKGKEHTFKQFNRSDGIINDMIHGIAKDNKGIIWLSTNKGLVKYNPENDSFLNVKSSQIGVIEYTDDAYWTCPITHRLFFGGVNGLVWIDPKNEDEQLIYKPDLLFTELNYFEKERTLYEFNKDPDKVLELPANQNTFQISFAVLDYLHGDNYDFSYLLYDYDTSWNSLQKETKISFTKLPPGSYTLKVKYKNDVLNADDNIYTLKLKILPPWYLSTYAYVVYVILFLGLVILLIYYARKKIRKKQELLAKRIKEEQKEKIYESKLRFFTNITHEFFTPLTLINGTVEQLKKEKNNPQIDKYIHILQNNVVSLNELVQEVLEYRKVEESETQSLTLKNISVSELLHNLLNSFTGIATQNQVSLSSHIQENINWNSDLACLKKITSNLISNAFKYTPVGGEIKIHANIEDNQLKIVVYNTGRGIDPDKIKTIFNRYRILEDTDVNTKNQMTARHGLGLYICHSLTKLLHGNITVESEKDSYTRFTLTLPNTTPNTTTPKTDPPTPNHTTPIEDTISPILIVDDNPEIVELINDILSQEYSVVGVCSASKALEHLKKQTPALIITDIMMPEIDGLSFIKTVREDKYNKHIPIIALSAKIEEQDQIKGYETGADAYMTKPFSSEVLLSIVNRFLVNREKMKDHYETAESAFEYKRGVLMHQKDREFIEKLTEILSENISNTKLGPDFLAEQLKMSSRNLYRQVKRILSVSPSDFIKDYKLSYTSKLLISTNLSIKEIIHKVGISNKSYFYREFAKKYNMSPKQYKDSHKQSPGS